MVAVLQVFEYMPSMRRGLNLTQNAKQLCLLKKDADRIMVRPGIYNRLFFNKIAPKDQGDKVYALRGTCVFIGLNRKDRKNATVKHPEKISQICR